MEFANHPSQIENSHLVRVAKRSDADKILQLLQTAVYRHLHVDWYLPGDWLGSQGFVVLAEKADSILSQAAKVIGTRDKLVGCLAAAADVKPIAWVRVAALEKLPDDQVGLATLLAPVEAYLKSQEITQLAWLVVEDWPRSWFEDLGFYIVNEIETYIKDDTAVPDIQNHQVQIKPAEGSQLNKLAEIEGAAFTPMWVHSVHALKLAFSQALSFDVAMVDDAIVGFQLSARSESGAHLVRITVDSNWQNRGIGSALMAHALKGYYRQGLQTVSLNTQIDNYPSQALYRKFGFRASGYRLPIWLKEFDHD